MFSSVAPAMSDEEDEATTREREADEDRLQAEFGANETHNDDRQTTPEQAATLPSAAGNKKRQRDTSPLTVSFALPTLPLSAPTRPSPRASSSSSSPTSHRPRLPPRSSRPSASTVAASDRAEMDESLSSLLKPSLGRPKKRGRPIGSTSDRLPAELQRRMGEANSLFVQCDYSACEQLLKSIIHQSRLSVAPYHTLVLVYEAQCDERRLCDTRQIIAELTPKDTENWKSLARSAQLTDDITLAERAVNRAIALSGGQWDEGVAWVKGWVEVGRKQWKKAAGTWSWLLERERNREGDVVIREMLVRSYRGMGLNEKAAEIAEEHIRMQREIADRAAGTTQQGADDGRVRAREQKRTEQRQRREQRQRDTLYSDDAGFDSDTDSAFYNSDSEDEGGVLSAAQSPLSLELVTALCWLYNQQHMSFKVNELMETVALLLPSGTSLSLELRSLHAIALLQLGHTQRAVIQLNRLLDVDFDEHPDHLPLLQLAAEAYQRVSIPQSALSAYRLLLPHAPYTNDPTVWVGMAKCLRSVGTTEEEWQEAKELYQRALEVNAGDTAARIGLAELEKDSGEDKEEEEMEEEQAPRVDKSAAVREKRTPKKRPVQTEATVAAVGRPLPALLPELPEEDIFVSRLLQTADQLLAAEERASDYHWRKEYAALIAEILPILQRTIQVASGVLQSLPQPEPSQHLAMPSLEDENGQPAWLLPAHVPPPPTQLTRRHRVAASRLLLSRAAFQITSYIVTALSSLSATAVSAATRSANLYTAVQLVGDLSTHYQLKRTVTTLESDCPRLLFGTLYKQCIPLLLAIDQTQQAYSYCQHMFDKQNTTATTPAASRSTASTQAGVADDDLDVVEVVGAVLRRMGYTRKVRRWLSHGGKDKRSVGHEVARRMLLAHSWYSHRGYHTAVGLYHQSLVLMRRMSSERQQCADWKRLESVLYLYLSLALLHRALSTSSRFKPQQKQQQTAQLLRSLAYITHYHSLAAAHTPAIRALNVGRWHQAARYDAQAVRWYEKVLAMRDDEGDEEQRGSGEVCGVGRFDARRRAAECLALVYKRSGNEMLASRLYAEYCS